MNLIDQIKENARNNKQRIILPESYEERTLRAADRVLQDGTAEIILLGKPQDIQKHAAILGLKNIGKATLIDPLTNEKRETYAKMMTELRKAKGLTMDQALEQLNNPLYFATVMIKHGDADGEVAGADNATGDVLRPAFQYVKTLPGISVVSGAFLMFLKDKEYGDNGLQSEAEPSARRHAGDGL